VSERHPVIARLRLLLDEWEARLLAGDRYARWANENHAAGMRVGGLSFRDRVRLVVAVWRMP
jgi:hypothetical protein